MRHKMQAHHQDQRSPTVISRAVTGVISRAVISPTVINRAAISRILASQSTARTTPASMNPVKTTLESTKMLAMSVSKNLRLRQTDKMAAHHVSG